MEYQCRRTLSSIFQRRTPSTFGLSDTSCASGSLIEFALMIDPRLLLLCRDYGTVLSLASGTRSTALLARLGSCSRGGEIQFCAGIRLDADA
jgi:hypothetical protein